MSNDQVLESFGRLLAKLASIPDNQEQCRILSRKYKPLIISDNNAKKNTAVQYIESILTPLYTQYRDDIIQKDFSFLNKDIFILDDVDVGILYMNVIDQEDSDALKLIVNELLYLFYQVSTPEDQKSIDTRYRKKTQPMPPQQGSQTTMTKGLEDILKKNKHILKKAESDPSAIPEVLSELFKNNSDQMAGLLGGMLGGMGIDPSQMK